MKKLLIFLCLFFYAGSYAQPATSFYGLSKVSDIATFKDGLSNTIIVKDTLRGGIFSLYAGGNPVDNGMIFGDAVGRKWLRQNVDVIDIRWFGALPGKPDNRQSILDAIESAKVNLPQPKIYVPATPNDLFYHVSDSITINDYIELYGDGAASKIKFAAHKKGLTFANPGTHYSIVKNIAIIGEAANAAGNKALWDNSKHGIVIKSPVYFTNVWVNYFDGCGFYIVNSLNDLSNPGNASTSTFTSCHAYYNLLHGIYISGGDANAMSFNNCDVVGNGGVGIYDKSFLGNHYSGNHAATNGSPEIPHQRGLVKSGGTVYACIKDITVGQAPPNSAYWQNIGPEWKGYKYVLDYNATTIYYAVAGYILEGANQYGTLLGNYCELDQAPGYIDYRNMDFGSNIPTRNLYPKIYGNLGNVRSTGFFAGDIGIVAPWIYSDDLSSYHPGLSIYPSYRGLMVGGTTKSGLVDFWDNNTRIGTHYTTSTALNILTQASKNLAIYTNNNMTTPKILVGTTGVGINKASADSTLDVDGSLRVSGAANLLDNISVKGNAAIGTTKPASSAQLDVASTTKGFLPPRMTATQASAIRSPAEGLLIYVTNTNGTFIKKGWWGYNGAAWEKLNN